MPLGISTVEFTDYFCLSHLPMLSALTLRMGGFLRSIPPLLRSVKSTLRQLSIQPAVKNQRHTIDKEPLWPWFELRNTLNDPRFHTLDELVILVWEDASGSAKVGKTAQLQSTDFTFEEICDDVRKFLPNLHERGTLRFAPYR